MINLTVVIDNDEAIKKLKELQNVAKQSTSSVVSDAERMDSAFNNLKGSIAELAGAAALGMFVNKVIQVRGEVQQLEVAFETMLGSKAKAEALMADVINLAAKTPFGLQDVSNATKMLLAYGSTAEQVTDEIKMLGNIASGLSIPLNDMIYLYGTTRTQGRMFTQDLRQFMGRGIPLAEELAKQFGVSKDKVGELVTEGKVGFDEMAKALSAMTSEGGKFNGLMDKQSQTIAGQISNLEDSIYQMFNAIGESQQGTISKGISMVSSLVENYEKVIDVISHLIIVYGAYKAAVMAVAAAQSVASMLKIVKTLYDVAKGAQTAAAAFSLLSGSTKGWVGLATGVISAIGISMMDFGQKAETATETMGELEQAAHDEYIEVNKLVFRLQDANTSESERREILEELRSINPDIVDGIDAESIAFGKLTSNLKNYNDEQAKRVQLAAINDRITNAAERKGKAELELADAKLALKKDVDTIVAEYLTSGKLPSIVYDQKYYAGQPGDTAKKKVEARLKDAVRRRAQNLITDEEFAEILNTLDEGITIYDPMAGEYRSFRSFFKYNVQGIKETGALKTIRAAEKEIEAANKDLEKTTKDSQYLLSTFGFLNEDNSNGTNGGGEEEQYLEAKINAYKAWVTELQKLQAIERGEVKATVDAWNTQIQNEENARKAYEALGGVTNKGRTKKTEKENNEAEKKHVELNKALLKADEDYAQAVVDLMEEGEAKKLAQIEVNYEKEKKAIDKEVEELKKLQDGSLTPEQEEQFDKRYDALEAKKQRNIADVKAAESKAMNEYLAEYGTYQEKLLAIKELYDEKITNAINEGERKTLEAERDTLIAEYEEQVSDWANSLVDMTTAQLNKMLAELQAQVEAKEQAFNALDNSDSEDAKKYREEINKLKAQIAALNEELGKTSRKADDKNWDESVQTFQEIARAANEAADGIAEFDEDLGNTLRSIAQLASTGLNLVVVIKKITDAAWTGAAAISAMEKASLILAAISAAIQVVSTLFNLFRQSDEVEETKRQFKELNDELVRLHKLARIDSVEGTIFGPNPFGNFINNLKAMQDALKDFEASKQAIREKDAQYIDSIVGWNPDGTAQTIKIAQGSQNLNDAIANMQVMTKHKTWFTDREYADLGDLVPDLFDEFGNVTLEGLQNLQNSDVWENLDKKDRELIEQMIADWEDYNAAVEATEKYLSDVFGNLGDDITNALLDSFKNGTDAAEAFGEATGKILDRLASDIVNMALIQPIMDEAEAELLELQKKLRDGDITYEEYLQQTKAVVDEAANKAKDRADDASELYEAAGIEQGSGSTQATSKGFQTMSQETGSELNGRFTDIQGQTHRIAEAVEFCKSLHIENLTQVQSINATVAMIHNDTSLIAQHTKVLANINANLDALRRSVDDGAI